MIKKIVVLIFVILILSFCVSARQIKLMTYNLETNKGLNLQLFRLSGLSEIISNSGADLVAVQEVVGNSNFSSIQSQTGLSGQWYDIAGNGYGIGLLWKSSLGTPIVTNYKVNPCSGSTDSESRAYMVAEFPEFCFISTHFSLNAVDRDTMTMRIIRKANTLGKTVFLAGDFNAQPTYRAIVTLKNNGFTILNDVTEFTYPSDAPTSTIDIILGFRKNTTDRTYTVLSNGVPAAPSGISYSSYSDHLPYYTTIDLQSATSLEGATTNPRRPFQIENGRIRLLLPSSATPVSLYDYTGKIILQGIFGSNDEVPLPDQKGKLFILKINSFVYKISYL